MIPVFNNIPGNLRVPFFHAEFQPGGTPYQSIARLVFLGQKSATGSATANEPVSVREGREGELFGYGSMLHQMIRLARSIAPVQEIWAVPLDDSGAGVAATGKITVAAAAFPLSQARTLVVYVGGRRYRIVGLTSDNNNSVATKLAAEINADSERSVAAAVNGLIANQVDLTCRWKGSTGNTIMLEHGLLNEDDPIARSVFSFTAMASGAGDPEISVSLANLGEEEFDWICAPYSDTTNLGHASDFMNDASGSWSWVKQLYGHYITVKADTYANLQTFGNARNDSHLSVVPCYKFESPSWLVAAAVGALAAKHLQTAPELSRPLQTLTLRGIVGPRSVADRLGISERQALYYDGISGLRFSRTGEVQVERIITMYQQNAWGDPDATYLDLNTMAQSMYGIRYIRQRITNTFGRVALASDTEPYRPGVARPRDIREVMIHAYSELAGNLAVFENPQLFARDLVVERDPVDANRVNAMLPLDHVNQLRILAVAAVNYMQRSQAALAA